MTTILFLGDSVTDCSRTRSAELDTRPEGLGQGWVSKVNDVLTARPESYTLYNRGYAGCMTGELMRQSDWWPETLDRVDVVSLMIGVNDVWMPFWRYFPHKIDEAIQHFKEVIEAVKPRCEHLIACEPIALPCGEVTQEWWPLLDQLSDGQRKVCDQLGVHYLSLQESLMTSAHGKLFDYVQDGVHPTDLGHRWISKQWLAFAAKEGLVHS